MRFASPAIWKSVAIALVVALHSGNSTANTPKLVAVLPLDVRQAEMDAPTRVALEESIRTAAGEALFPLGYTVLTGETTLGILAENGIDPDRACEASCALDTARELKAELFISGTVALTEGYYTAFIRLFESRTARQLGALALEGKTVREVRREFAQQADSFFGRLLAPPETAQDTVTEPTPEPSPALAVSDRLSDGPRVESPGTSATSPQTSAPPPPTSGGEGLGTSSPATPSPSVAPVSPRQTSEGDFARAGVPDTWPGVDTTPHPTAAWISVESDPPGLEVTLDGNFLGVTPLVDLEVIPGMYTLSVDDGCFQPTPQSVVLAYGDRRTFMLQPEPRTVDLRIEATNPFGEPVVASAWAQGRRLDRVPGTVAVPICATRIEVENANGRWSGDVSLSEDSTGTIVAVLTRQGNHVGSVSIAPSSTSFGHDTHSPSSGVPRTNGKTAVRLGSGAAMGWAGMSVEYRRGWLGYSVGFGVPSYIVGLTFGSPANDGGLYGDLMLSGNYLPLFPNSFLGDSRFGVSASVGWDWRFLDLLSVKTGIGMYATEDGPRLPLVDLAVGAVF